MSETNKSNPAQILWSTLAGMLSFLISGMLACVVLLRLDNYIVAPVIAGCIGGLLIGLFHWKQKAIGRMTVAGLVAVPVGFLGSFVLVEGLAGGFSLLFPSLAAGFENSGIADVFAIILMGVVFGVIFGAIVYGRKSLGLFSVVCGVASIPFGLLVRAMNSGQWIKGWFEDLFMVLGKIDLNFLAIILEFGVGIGLSIGLFNRIKLRKP